MFDNGYRYEPEREVNCCSGIGIKLVDHSGFIFVLRPSTIDVKLNKQRPNATEHTFFFRSSAQTHPNNMEATSSTKDVVCDERSTINVHKHVHGSLLKLSHPKSSATIDLCILDAYSISKEPDLQQMHTTKWPMAIEIPIKLPQFSPLLVNVALRRNKGSVCVWIPSTIPEQHREKYNLIIAKMAEKKLSIFIPLSSNGMWLSLFPVSHFSLLRPKVAKAMETVHMDKLKDCFVSLIVDSYSMQIFQQKQREQQYRKEQRQKPGLLVTSGPAEQEGTKLLACYMTRWCPIVISQKTVANLREKITEAFESLRNVTDFSLEIRTAVAQTKLISDLHMQGLRDNDVIFVSIPFPSS